VFLHSWCDAGLCSYYFILALAKTVTPAGAPGGAGAACAAQWFLPGGFSRKAGPIKHQLVLVC